MWRTYWYSKNREGTSHNKRVSGFGFIQIQQNRISYVRQTLGGITRFMIQTWRKAYEELYFLQNRKWHRTGQC